ncbi:hypothetical protein TNCV_1545171 [Trichonephila clavipes]|nr:hypothetical protein TNCV_1545171 [Trichonephila clavipes]
MRHSKPSIIPSFNQTITLYTLQTLISGGINPSLITQSKTADSLVLQAKQNPAGCLAFKHFISQDILTAGAKSSQKSETWGRKQEQVNSTRAAAVSKARENGRCPLFTRFFP